MSAFCPFNALFLAGRFVKSHACMGRMILHAEHIALDTTPAHVRGGFARFMHLHEK